MCPEIEESAHAAPRRSGTARRQKPNLWMFQTEPEPEPAPVTSREKLSCSLTDALNQTNTEQNQHIF